MIRLIGVNKQLGNFALKNIDLRIKRNEYFVILGPTGTGKTVILEVIAGMYPLDSGEIHINGEDVTRQYPEDRHVGFVYQDYMLFPHLKVRDNILFGLKARKTPQTKMQEKLGRMVKMLNIGHLLDRVPATLSGGEQQRVAIARALVTEPELLLLDEPLSALDPRTKEIFQQELRRLHQEIKTTTIHITHDFNEAMVLADRIAVMRQGEIVQVGTPEDVFQKPNTEFIASFVGTENIYQGEIRPEADGAVVRVSKLDFYVSTKQSGRVGIALRPEGIVLSAAALHSSARNCLAATVQEVRNCGILYKVQLAAQADPQVTFIATVTKQSVEAMEISLGKRMFVSFKATAVHVFPLS